MLLLIGGGAWVYFALRHVPRFYEEAVKIDPAQRKQGSDEMLRRSASLRNDARKRGRWQAAFTAEQINGWLAVDLVENYPKLLPPEVHDPRVAIHDGQIVVGCRFDGKVSTIVSLEADVSLPEPNVIAVRIRRARAGAVPLPLDKFLPEAIRALQDAGFLGGPAASRRRSRAARYGAAGNRPRPQAEPASSDPPRRRNRPRRRDEVKSGCLGQSEACPSSATSRRWGTPIGFAPGTHRS